MPLARFEPAIPASERPQTHALDRADEEICSVVEGLRTVLLVKLTRDYNIYELQTNSAEDKVN